jgi:hypothetical protein
VSDKLNPVDFVPFAAQGWSNYRIADKFGINESTVRRGLDRLGYKRYKLPEDHPSRYSFDLDTPVVVTGDVMVTADFHIPLYDPVLVNHMIDKARELGITQLIIAGDFFNFDALSQYDPKQDGADLEREWYEGVAVMRVLLETFDRIVYTWGNHDSRMHKSLGFKMKFAEAMRMVFGILGDEALERIEITNLDHVIVEAGKGGTYYVCHPQNYNSTPLASARKIANKQNRHVITAHSHHIAVGLAEDGEKIVIEAGGFHDKTKTAYLQRSTTFPSWAQGYVWLKGGRPYVYAPKWEIA